MNRDDEEEEEDEVDAATQQMRWKIEAFVIKAMKQAQTMTHQQLVAVALQQWQALGRPEPMSAAFVEDRLKWLVKREWFSVSGDGVYTQLDLSQQHK
jgi:hypothetical protein